MLYYCSSQIYQEISQKERKKFVSTVTTKFFSLFCRLGKLPSLDLPLSIANNCLVLGDAFLVVEKAVNRCADSASDRFASALLLLVHSYSSSSKYKKN